MDTVLSVQFCTESIRYLEIQKVKKVKKETVYYYFAKKRYSVIDFPFYILLCGGCSSICSLGANGVANHSCNSYRST